MKLQNINSNYNIKYYPTIKAKPIKTVSKPLEEPVKKSGKTLGGMIMSGLAALGLVSDKKEEEKPFTHEEYELIKRKFYKTANERYCGIDCYSTKFNIPVFRWLLTDRDEDKNFIRHAIYNEHNWMEYVKQLFYTPEIPREHIAGIIKRWDSNCDEPYKSIETYKINIEKINELTPLIDEYKPQNAQEEYNKEVVTNYLHQPPYKQNLSYVTKDLLEKFIKESPFLPNYGYDVLSAKNKEQFDLRLDFLKFLSKLPKEVNWQTLDNKNSDEDKYDHINLDLVKYINKDNVEFIKELIKGGNYSIDLILYIACYTDKDTLETMRAIFNDERIIEDSKDGKLWTHIEDGLAEINKNNAKTVLELFNLSKEWGWNYVSMQLKEFANTPKSTMTLCKTYNINPRNAFGKKYITPESAPVIKKIENNEKYNENYWTIRELAQMASQNRQAKELIEALTDKNCEIGDIKKIYNSVFDIRDMDISKYHLPAKSKFPAILSIAGNKDLTSSQTNDLLWDCDDRPIGFLAKHLENKNINLKYITEYWPLIYDFNINLASKLLWNKKFNQKYLANILRNYTQGSNKDVLEIIESGKFDENPELAKFPTDAWKFIMDNNLKLDEIDKNIISLVAKYNNPKLIELHNRLKRDVYSSKNILKPGLEELTESDLKLFLNSEDTLLTLQKVGKGVLESTFPETIYGVEDFCRDVGGMDLPENLYEQLALKIYPENSKKYKDIEKGVNVLKEKIRELAGSDLLSKKEKIEAKASPVLNEIKELKIEASKLEDNDERKTVIKKEINAKTKILNQLRQEINMLYRQSEKYDEINGLMKEIYTKQSEMKNLIASKIDLSPQKIAEKVRVIAQLATCYDENTDKESVEKYRQSKLEQGIDLIKSDTEENEAEWNNFVNNLIFDFMETNYSDSEKEKLSKKLDLIHSKYLSKLFISDGDFYENLEKLVNCIKNNIDLPIEEIIDNLPQNIETKRQFEELGVDYEKWTKIDKNSYVSVKVKLDAAEAKRAAIDNLEEDLNDEMFSKIPQEQYSAICSKIKKAGFEIRQDKKVIYDENGFNAGQKDFNRIYKDGKPIEFENLGKVIDAVKEQINNDEFWFKENQNEETEKAKEHLYYHLMKMRVPEFENAKNMKDGEEVNVEVHKTDMYDIKRALGLGNDASCCTALGSNCNEWTAPNYIMNKCIGAIELMDRGNFAGNTMIYLAKVDGELSLILDNIEMKAKYQFNNEIKDAFFEYAHKLCAEIEKPDMPIYAGPNRHKVDMTGYEIKEREMVIMGNSAKQEVYLDFDAYGHLINRKGNYKVDLYKIS